MATRKAAARKGAAKRTTTKGAATTLTPPNNGGRAGPGATARGRPIVFVVTGRRSTQPFGAFAAFAASGTAARGAPGAAPEEPTPGTLKAGVRLAAQRGGGESHRLEAVPGEDVVALHVAGGPVLWLHPESARDLLRAQGGPGSGANGGGARRGRSPGAPAAAGGEADNEVIVGATLRWQGAERAARARGWLGDVVLAAVEIFKGRSSDEEGDGGLKGQAYDWVASRFLRKVDEQVVPGLYALGPNELEKLKESGARPIGGAEANRIADAGASPGPTLVLIHGTFVETSSTFKKLWTEHPARVRELFARYAGRVFALDHPTMGASPIANALTLVQALPKGAPVRLHLLTHSRGGLVAEVLVRVVHQKKVGAADLAYFKGDEYAAHRRDLEALAREVAARDLRVERVVRVACPARGTLLASKRLDAYLSVLRWTLKLANVPVAPAIVEFLAEVAKRRADPALIPGIAAMMPTSPLLRWLNEAPEPVHGQLLVVAGDLRGQGVVSWVKTLLADAFYWGDNDIVVHTRAMYAGAPRAGGAGFLLDQGGEVSHFNYFANERTAGAVATALLAPPALPSGFAPIGPLSWRGEDASGVRARRRGGGRGGRGDRDAAARAAAVANPSRPAVFLLPGILGSNLRSAEHRLWMAFRIVAGLHRLAYKPAGTDGIEDDGPINLIYDDLADFLGATHEVVRFGFDWRRPIEEEAARLARTLAAALDARKASGQPVRLIAHSMGGVLARTVQLVAPQVWSRLMERPGARLVMLGTPNGGSWAPMQVLSGDDTFGNLLALIGAPFSDSARNVMAAMPGFVQLQAGLTDPALDLGNAKKWEQLARDDFEQLQAANLWHRSAGDAHQEEVYRWGLPSQRVLDQAVALRKRLDEQVSRQLVAFADKLCLVVGRARFTPDGYEVGDDGFVYLDAVDGGDGRVPLASALLPQVRTWVTDIEHGSLASKDKVFAAYLDLLQTGTTTRLPPLPADAAEAALRLRRSRGGALSTSGRSTEVQHVRSRPSRQVALAVPPRDERDVAAGALPAAPEAALAGAAPPRSGAPDAAAGEGGLAFAVTVHNGDLSFIRQPTMIGHYRSLKLSGAEAVLDRLLGGGMSASLATGVYPEACGTAQIFVNAHRAPDNPWAEPHPKAAIVVGLGDEGGLDAAQLADTVRQGAMAWAQRLTEAPGGTAATFELAATLMGSGGVGIQAGDAARAIVEGLHQANQRLAANGWPVVGELTLIELFLDRATDAWRALRLLANSRADLFALAPAIASGPGARRRMPHSGYRGADYDLVRITGGDRASGRDGVIEFSLDTRRARTEVRAEKTQGLLVRELVAGAAQHGEHDADIGRTLLRLLVPLELEPFLGGTTQLVLDLDQRTAPIPWELLELDDHAGADTRPWALRCRLLRKLRTPDFTPAAPRDANADDAVLVVGEPRVPADYDPLPAARAEAEAVLAKLTGTGGIGSERVAALLGDSADAPAVVGALLRRRWRIVHVAGHGEPPDDKQPEQKPNGVVLSGGAFLGPNEIRKMRAVPELVFVNCCHLAAHDAKSTLADRPKFAAGVADALIRLGVRCVVAAGWAVDDEPAQIFAEAFYESLLAGAPFIEAVGEARAKAWAADPRGKTWAAYQCYGDPNWTYRERTGDAQSERARAPSLAGPAAEYDYIATASALAQTLEDMAIVQRNQPGRDKAPLRDRLRHLQARFAEATSATRWGELGSVAEAFGVAWEAAGDRDQAITWYERAVAAADAGATMKAAQSLNNLRVRRAELRAREAAAVAAAPATAAAALAAAAATDLRPGEARSAPASASAGGLARKAPPAPQARSRRSARAASSASAAAARSTPQEAIAEVEAARNALAQLAGQHPSVEGYSLVGSANKRLALLHRRTGDAAAARSALEATIGAYGEAERIARMRGAADLFYPALNRIAAELVLKAGDKAPVALDAAALTAVRASLEVKHESDADFWSATAFVELDLYEAVAARQLAKRKPALLERLADVHRRRDDASAWESVATQADFVLGACVDQGSAEEAAAARELRGVLAGYAGGVGGAGLPKA